MQADGVIGKYAIGGAVGATFYLEPAATLDVDIFAIIPMALGKGLVSLTPIYEYLRAKGCAEKDEHIVIGGWPVQFLPPSDDLEREGVNNAIQTTIEGTPTWVMQAEHLVAIALRTGRLKDYGRIVQFFEKHAVDRNRLLALLERHGLLPKWRQFEQRYLEGSHG
jgi:hypothetical protein